MRCRTSGSCTSQSSSSSSAVHLQHPDRRLRVADAGLAILWQSDGEVQSRFSSSVLLVLFIVIPAECKQVGNVNAAKFVKMLDSVNLASLVDTGTLIGLVLCIFCVGCTGLLCAWFEETTIRVKPRLSPARKVGTTRVKQRRFGGLLRATYVANQNTRLHTALKLSSCSLWGLCNASWFHAACCLVSKCKSLLTVRRVAFLARRLVPRLLPLLAITSKNIGCFAVGRLCQGMASKTRKTNGC